MKKNHLRPLTPAALYAMVADDRQAADLSAGVNLISASHRCIQDNRGAS